MNRMIRNMVLIIMVLYTAEAGAQVIKSAVMLGGNVSHVEGDRVYGWRHWGMNGGVAAIIPFHKNFSVMMEMSYSQKGSNHRANSNGMDYGKKQDYDAYHLDLDYVEIPVLFQYNDKEMITFGTGFSYGRLVNVKEIENGSVVKSTSLEGGPYAMDDFCWLADVQFRVYGRLKANLRYSTSMASIRKRYFVNPNQTRNQSNSVISFRLMYIFNEKASKKRMEEKGAR